MIDMNSFYQIVGVIGTVITIIGFGFAFYSTRVFSNGIKNTSLLHIRSLIKRMEEEKQEHERNSPAWKAMHHTQQQLDTLFKSLQKTFKISDESAPL